MDFYCSQLGSQNSAYQSQGQTSHLGSQSVTKSVNKRRSWSLLEEKILLQAFTEIMSQGWKTPNGFRNGFLLQLEQKMRVSLPGTDLRGEPHIASKYGSWKKTFRDVAQVLSNSGFNWNAGTKTIDAFPHVWDAWCKAHPTTAYVREKPFPFYEVWVDIYGKDRATRIGAMDFQQISQQLEQPHVANSGEEVHESAPRTANFGVEEDAAQSEKSTTPSGSGNRKRKRLEISDDVLEMIQGMWTKATETLEKEVVRMGYEIEESAQRKKVYEAIGELPITISMKERFDAAYEISMKPMRVDLFFSLPEDAKCEMVRRAIEGTLK